MNRRILSLSLILSLGCFPGVDRALYAQTIVSQPQNGQVSGVVTGSDGVPPQVQDRTAIFGVRYRP